MDPPPSHHLRPPPSAAASQAQNPTFYTPMSPYKSPNPTPYSLPQPPIPAAAIPFSLPHRPNPMATTIPYPSHAANSTVYYPPSSFSNVGHPQNSWHLLPRSHAIVNNPPPIPHPNHSNDDYLRRLRNEVFFLHGLWHQGPPNSNSDLSSIGDLVPNLHLKPSAFKKKKKKNPRPRPVPDNPWPISSDPPAPPESESGWPQFPARPTPPSPVASEEDRARVSAIRVQQKSLDSFRSFFGRKNGSESGTEGDDDGDDQEHGSDDCAKFDKILEFLEGDEELKGYYEKNWGNGVFLCLVCGGTGQKVGRKYKNCLALVQHTVTISNTKKKAAHRAYGQVICKILGWDINQLPLVSRNLSLQQGNEMSSADACKDDHVSVETNIASLATDKEQSDVSKATCEVSSAEACKDDHVTIERNIASLVNCTEQSGASKATCELGSAEACNVDQVSVENIVSLVNDKEQSEGYL